MSDPTCTNHNDQQRTECPVCLVTQLRAELADQAARFHDEIVSRQGTVRANQELDLKELNHLRADLDAIKAILNEETNRAEKAEAVLLDPQQLHAHCLRTLNEGQIAHLFGGRMTEIVSRAEKAEVELNLWQEGCIVREEDRTALAAERARLDWLLQDDVTRFDLSYHDRAAIDAAMKEGAK